MGLLILGHVLGDFYIQTDKIADKKQNSTWYLLLHCFLYTLGMIVIVVAFTGNLAQGIKLSILIGLSHIVVDTIKVKIDRVKFQQEYIAFLIDQTVHLFILCIIAYFFRDTLKVIGFSSLIVPYGISINKIIAILITALLCWKPSAIFISLVFQAIPRTIEEAECEMQESIQSVEKCITVDKNTKKEAIKELATKESRIKESNTKESKTIESSIKESATSKLLAREQAKRELAITAMSHEEVVKIGSWIGILEREIILILGLMGQYGAIGFVLTAKSVARYKQLENKAFAEKYLVGTLLSALIAIAGASICSLL
jgi:hypothetical protein